MIEELYRLLDRQVEAVTALEARIRALELVVAADERRFVALALDEFEHASEQLGGLELARSLALSSAGIDPDLSATDLLARIPDEGDRAMLGGVVERLRAAHERLAEARDRAEQVVGRGAGQLRARIDAASVLVGTGAA